MKEFIEKSSAKIYSEGNLSRRLVMVWILLDDLYYLYYQ